MYEYVRIMNGVRRNFFPTPTGCGQRHALPRPEFDLAVITLHLAGTKRPVRLLTKKQTEVIRLQTDLTD
jgi:hypothetical protein